jgi:hypothetical protein
MAQYILSNDVSMSQNGQVARLRAAKLVDSLNQDITKILAAGGVLIPNGVGPAAQAALLAKYSRYKGQGLMLDVAQVLDAIPVPPSVSGVGTTFTDLQPGLAASSSSLGNIAAGSKILMVTVNVTTPYAGAGAVTLALGQLGSPTLLIASLDLTQQAQTSFIPLVPWGAAALPLLATTAGSPSAGACDILVLSGVPQT